MSATCEMVWLADNGDGAYDCTREAVTTKKIDGEILLLCWTCNEQINYYGADVVGVIRDDELQEAEAKEVA